MCLPPVMAGLAFAAMACVELIHRFLLVGIQAVVKLTRSGITLFSSGCVCLALLFLPV